MSTSPPEQTVIVTTKNTASLTLGIIALVIGVLSLLVGWVPYLGLVALPVAVIGLLLAGIALVKGGRGFGMPVLGGIICCGGFVLPILSTGSGTTFVIPPGVGTGFSSMRQAQTGRQFGLFQPRSTGIGWSLSEAYLIPTALAFRRGSQSRHARSVIMIDEFHTMPPGITCES